MNRRAQRGLGLASGGTAAVIAALLFIPSESFLVLGALALVVGLAMTANGLLVPDGARTRWPAAHVWFIVGAVALGACIGTAAFFVGQAIAA